MMHQLFYTREAERDLKGLDRKNARRILEKLLFFSKQKDPLAFAKRLVGLIEPRYRFRVGDYRIIFRINENGEINILMILSVKHRREVYRL